MSLSSQNSANNAGSKNTLQNKFYDIKKQT